MVAGVHEMENLYPPGVRNTANVCYASSIIHCLLNQEIFKRAFEDAASNKSSSTTCQGGRKIYIMCSAIKPTKNTLQYLKSVLLLQWPIF